MNNHARKITRCLSVGMFFIFLSAACACCFANVAMSEEKPPILYLTKSTGVKVCDFDEESPTSSFGARSILGNMSKFRITAKPGLQPMGLRVYNLSTAKDGTGDIVDLDIKVSNITPLPGHSPDPNGFGFSFRGRYNYTYEEFIRKPGYDFSMWLDTTYIYANIKYTILNAGTHNNYDTNIYVSLADIDITPSYTYEYISSEDGSSRWRNYISPARPSPLFPCYGCEHVKGLGHTVVSPTLGDESILVSGNDGSSYVHSPIPAKGSREYARWMLGANAFPVIGNEISNAGPETCATLVSDSNVLEFQYGGTICGINFSFARPLEIEYYVDGEKSPFLVDRNHISGTTYEIPDKAARLGQKDYCLGVSQWYLDPAYTKKYVAQELTRNLKLYGRNEVSIRYSSTSHSGIRDSRFDFYENEDLSTKVIPYNLYPQKKKYYYGDVYYPNDMSALPYVEVFYSKAGLTKSLVAQGVYSNFHGTVHYPDKWTLQSNMIIYIDWPCDTGDRIISGW